MGDFKTDISHHPRVVYWVDTSHLVQKGTRLVKKTPWTLQKTAGLARKSVFLRYAHKTHFFGLRQT